MNHEVKIRKPVLKPLPVECFYEKGRIEYQGKILTEGRKCGKIFEIKYNRTTGQYVQRNNWDYWTQKDEDKGKYICNNCLITLYRKDKYFFWESVRSERKKRTLGNYVNSGSLS